MRIIHTNQSQPDDIPTQQERDWVYNGLDCCVTSEVLDAIRPQLDDLTSATYSFSRALQGPALEMRLRGVLVDQSRKSQVITEYREKISQLEDQLDRIVLEGVGLPTFNWRSYPDLQKLFYSALGIPPIRSRGRPTVDRKALEKLRIYNVAKPIVNHMTAIRDLFSLIKTLTTEIDPDGRMRTSYNIAGTSTGRFSSSFSEFGTGGNLQNITEELRSVFISDPGMKFAKFDARQIQSRLVGALEWQVLHDGTYLDVCESADLHTTVAKMTWPELPWTGDPKKDKQIAEQPFYRHLSYRDMCKKLGHGSNFDGQPPRLHEETQVPEVAIREFQHKYFRAFPGHHKWQNWTRNEIRTKGYLISLTGRKRWFFGRRNDDATFREAFAYSPQADESFIVGSGMLNIWRRQTATIMMHEHDGLVYQYPEELEDEIVPALLQQLEFPVDIGHGRTLIIPYEAKIGWNRGNYDARKNPDGLKDYHGHDERKRQPQVSILDRIIHRSHSRA